MKIMRLKYKNLKVLMRVVRKILFAVIVFPQTTKGIECNSQPQLSILCPTKICVPHYLPEMEETKKKEKYQFNAVELK